MSAPTKSDLMAQCQARGIHVSPKDTKAMLMTKLGAKSEPKAITTKDPEPQAAPVQKASVYDQPAKAQPRGGAANGLAVFFLLCVLIPGAITLHHFFGPKDTDQPAVVHQQAPKPQPRKASVYASGDSVAECEARQKKLSNYPIDCPGDN